MAKQAIKLRISQLLEQMAAQTGPRFEKRLARTKTLAALHLQTRIVSLAAEPKHRKYWLVVIVVAVVAATQTSRLLQTLVEFAVRINQFAAAGQRVL